jgi:hypothetical protein
VKHLFGAYEYEFVCKIEPERDEYNEIKLFMPQDDYLKRELSKLHAYGSGPFCRFRIPTTIRFEGVYILTVDEVPYYVGECVDLSKRYNVGYGQNSPRNCYAGGQATNCRLNNLIYQATTLSQQIDLWFLETTERHAVERTLIRELNTRARWDRKD